MNGRDSQSKVASGTGCGISRKRSRARINVSSTEGQPLKRLMIGRMTESACSIGPKKASQVCTSVYCGIFTPNVVIFHLLFLGPLHGFRGLILSFDFRVV